MKPLLKLTACIFLTGVLAYFSCKKEFSCENCLGANKPPIANAGSDTSITLPADSILLDGSKSSDPDDGIASYAWTKISGPDTFNIPNPSSSISSAKNLVRGTYRFELTVTDKGGLSAKDTMQVIVFLTGITNRPPVANAGKDTTHVLPVNIVMLDGSGSTDPDNNIASYLWTAFSGPPSANIVNRNEIRTQVINIVPGTYKFELKVTDSGGLRSTDTVIIVINAISNQPTCLPANRPIIQTELVPFGTLSQARTMISVASAGNKILFAGGQTSSGIASPIVDIFDLSTQSWSTAQLSVPRYEISAISVGNKIYFAGGRSNYIDTPSSRIDIYDVVTNTWSIAALSEPRSGIAAATIGNKIFFAGGYNKFTCTYCTSNKVDIYDISTNNWAAATLSIKRGGMSATTVANKIYFAGGHEFWLGTGVYDRIDIYDNTTNTWSISNLVERKAHHGAIAIGNNIYWAGGEIWNNSNDYETTCSVERRNVLTGTSTMLHLFQPSYANSNAQPSMETLLKNGSIVFYTGGSQFDIYDPGSDIWSIGKMTQGFDFAGVISVNNVIYIAGGGFPAFTPISNQVWKLEF